MYVKHPDVGEYSIENDLERVGRYILRLTGSKLVEHEILFENKDKLREYKDSWNDNTAQDRCIRQLLSYWLVDF